MANRAVVAQLVSACHSIALAFLKVKGSNPGGSCLYCKLNINYFSRCNVHAGTESQTQTFGRSRRSAISNTWPSFKTSSRLSFSQCPSLSALLANIGKDGKQQRILQSLKVMTNIEDDVIGLANEREEEMQISRAIKNKKKLFIYPTS